MKKMMIVMAVLTIALNHLNAQGKSAEAKTKNTSSSNYTTVSSTKPGKDKNSGLTNEQLATKQVDGMIKRFAFPSDLKVKLYPIFLERLQVVRKAKSADVKDTKAISAANAKFRTQLQQVLSADQFATVKKAWEEKKEKLKKAKTKGKKFEEGDELED